MNNLDSYEQYVEQFLEGSIIEEAKIFQVKPNNPSLSDFLLPENEREGIRKETDGQYVISSISVNKEKAAARVEEIVNRLQNMKEKVLTLSSIQLSYLQSMNTSGRNGLLGEYSKEVSLVERNSAFWILGLPTCVSRAETVLFSLLNNLKMLVIPKENVMNDRCLLPLYCHIVDRDVLHYIDEIKDIAYCSSTKKICATMERCLIPLHEEILMYMTSDNLLSILNDKKEQRRSIVLFTDKNSGDYLGVYKSIAGKTIQPGDFDDFQIMDDSQSNEKCKLLYTDERKDLFLQVNTYDSIQPVMKRILEYSKQHEEYRVVIPYLGKHIAKDQQQKLCFDCMNSWVESGLTKLSAVPILFLYKDKEKSVLNECFQKLLLSLYKNDDRIERSILVGPKKIIENGCKEYIQSVLHGEKEKEKEGGISLMTWNILAKCYGRGEFWHACQKQYLSWTYRKERILQTIYRLSPSILMLQECDKYYDYWKYALASIGYNSIYVQRNNGKHDGCCIAFTSEMEVEEYYPVYCDDLCEGVHLENDRIDSSIESDCFVWEEDDGLRRRFDSYTKLAKREMKESAKQVIKDNVPYHLEKNNVAIIAIIRRGEERIMVINTHLFWKPQFPQIKLFQVMYILSIAHSIYEHKADRTVPVIFALDSNSTPSSQVYQYIYEMNPYFKFRSVYANAYHNNEPLFTNYTDDFIGCLDYIFYTHPYHVSSYSPLPSFSSMRGVNSLPNAFYPSDHLPLSCDGSILYEEDQSIEKTLSPPRCGMTQPFFQYIYANYSLC